MDSRQIQICLVPMHQTAHYRIAQQFEKYVQAHSCLFAPAGDPVVFSCSIHVYIAFDQHGVVGEEVSDAGK